MKRDWRTSGPLLLGPLGLICAAALILIPIVSISVLSSTKLSWTGLTDFGVSCDPPTLLLTSLYVSTTVFLQMVIGILSALAVYLLLRGHPLLLSITVAALTLPYAIPSTIGFTLWEFTFSWGGTIQEIFFPNRSPLDGTWSRFATLIALSIWQFFPFSFLLILAAFLTVPNRQIASAKADGATNYILAKRFLLPHAAPVIVAATTIRIVLMATKLDTPLAFDITSSNDYACLAAVRIYTSLGLGGDLIPFGLVFSLAAIVMLILTTSGLALRGWRR